MEAFEVGWLDARREIVKGGADIRPLQIRDICPDIVKVDAAAIPPVAEPGAFVELQEGAGKQQCEPSAFDQRRAGIALE